MRWLVLKIVVSAATILGVGTLISKLARTPREKIVEAAEGQLGEQDPDKYWAIVQPAMVKTGAAWCGGFALWALKQAGLAGNIDWSIGKGFIFKGNNGRQLPVTHAPKPGDIAYFNNLQHHAIVKEVNGNELITIDGNQGPGEQVKLRTRGLNDATAFYSIEPLIQG